MDGVRRSEPGNRITEGAEGPASRSKAPAAGTPATPRATNAALPGARNASDETSSRRATFSAPGSASAKTAGAEQPAAATHTPPAAPKGPLQPMQGLIAKQLRNGEGFEKTLASIETHSGLMANPMNRAAGMAALLENFHLASSTDRAGPGTNARYQSFPRILNAMNEQMRSATTPEVRDALNHVDSLVPDARQQLKLGERAMYGIMQVINPDGVPRDTQALALENALTAIEIRADVLSLPNNRAVIMQTLMENLHQIPNDDQAGPMSNARYQSYMRLAAVMPKEATTAANVEDPLAMPEVFISELNAWMDIAKQYLRPTELAAIDNAQ